MKLSDTYTTYPFEIKKKYSFLWKLLKTVTNSPFYSVDYSNKIIDIRTHQFSLMPTSSFCSFSNYRDEAIFSEGIYLHLLKSHPKYRVDLSNVIGRVRIFTYNSTVSETELSICTDSNGVPCDYTSDTSFSLESVHYILVMSETPLTLSLKEEKVDKKKIKEERICMKTKSSSLFLVKSVHDGIYTNYVTSEDFSSMRTHYIHHLKSMCTPQPNTLLSKNLVVDRLVDVVLSKDSSNKDRFKPNVSGEYRTFLDKDGTFSGIRVPPGKKAYVSIRSLRFLDNKGGEVLGSWEFGVITDSGSPSSSSKERAFLIRDGGYNLNRMLVKEQSFSFVISLLSQTSIPVTCTGDVTVTFE